MYRCRWPESGCSATPKVSAESFVPGWLSLMCASFSKAARARIQWLEAVIRERLPDVDLSEGPQVEILAEVPSRPLSKPSHQQGEERYEVPSNSEGPAATSSSHNFRQAMKRTHEAVTHSDHEDSLPEGAHSVAVNLGMLSLNSDSSQRHYLGSSSGLLFSNLIAASPSSTGGSPEYSRNAPDSSTGLLSRTLRPEAAQRRFQSFKRLLNEVCSLTCLRCDTDILVELAGQE